ncbi:hypothetical protein DPMN_062505 [Dreissena polymorpha]|uniref:Uncharacterized protein n=1 Tax=Dreissena polymorpha TaxID=45954 RepID=A0A9D4C9V4_DREPO|nr:hypothetical protein DPMN_062505 [Dreissena polymorpha]
MQFAVTADCYFPVQNMPCFTVRTKIQTKRLNPVKADRARLSPGIPSLRRHSAGLYRHQTPTELRQRPALIGDNRGSTGKVLKCLIPPG